MLGKLIKHDLNYSKKSFLGLGLAMLGFVLISFLFNRIFPFLSHANLIGFIFIISTTVSLVITISYLYSAFKNSLFGQNGYLYQTLPVGKWKLLLSKIISTLIWFNYIWLINLIFWILLAILEAQGLNFAIGMISLTELKTLIMVVIFVNIIVSLFLLGLYMIITLANSSFKNFRIHWILAGIIGFGTFIIWGYGLSSFIDLNEKLFLAQMSGSPTSPFNTFNVVVPSVYNLLFSGLLFFVTAWLLKNKVELD